MSVKFNILVAMSLAMGVAVARADEQSRYAALASLGELNGIALQCKYLDQVRRMKAAVVANAPKERSFGLAFDEATNKSFLAFIRQQRPCPGHAGFDIQVGERMATVEQVFHADR